jgi:chromosome segregation ATPase
MLVSAIDSHVRSLTESLVMAQKDIFPHRTIHQDAMSKLRTSQGSARLIQDEIDECRETLLRLHEETSQQDALAPQLQALQENNMSLPPEIAQAIRSYDSQRAIKIEEVKRQEAAIAAKTDKLERAQDELEAAEKNCSGLEAEIQRLQSVVTRGTEATRLAHMFGVVVQLGPEGLASIERIYPEIGSLLESLLAARGQPAQQPYLSQVEKVERE